MAWNEPGGNKPNDPWGGGGGNNQGPPDLDEALRKFQERLKEIFGGRGSGGSGGSGGSIVSGSMIVALVVVLAVVWAILGFYRVDAQEQAVILRLGKYYDTVGPGLHWNPKFIDRVTAVNVTAVRQYTAKGLMLTKDENIVDMPLTVQYNIDDAKAFVLNVKMPEVSLEQATDSAVRHTVGDSTLDQALSEGRAQIASDVKHRLQSYLNNYGTGIKILEVNLHEAKPPSPVQSAFDDVTKAKEDQERVKDEAQAYANSIIPQARGSAQRTIEQARAYRSQVVAEAGGNAKRFEELLTEYNKAPKVTRERLYIETMEDVLGRSSKVLVDAKGSNSMFYLPLDKLVKHAAGSSQPEVLSQDAIDSISKEVAAKLRQQSNSFGREGRQ